MTFPKRFKHFYCICKQPEKASSLENLIELNRPAFLKQVFVSISSVRMNMIRSSHRKWMCRFFTTILMRYSHTRTQARIYTHTKWKRATHTQAFPRDKTEVNQIYEIRESPCTRPKTNRELNNAIKVLKTTTKPFFIHCWKTEQHSCDAPMIV